MHDHLAEAGKVRMWTHTYLHLHFIQDGRGWRVCQNCLHVYIDNASCALVSTSHRHRCSPCNMTLHEHQSYCSLMQSPRSIAPSDIVPIAAVKGCPLTHLADQRCSSKNWPLFHLPSLSLIKSHKKSVWGWRMMEVPPLSPKNCRNSNLYTLRRFLISRTEYHVLLWGGCRR